ncbi:hypothetical protein MKEN_01331800 [Mycena kentingensis (nom. inval.)]|nr:hypothetical protein MKEN_01331800 [Mycena kentingensis (nom. inval.)]
MREYTFDSAHILRSALRDTYLARVYTTRTVSTGSFQRSTTTLEHATNGSAAVIDWTGKSFQVGADTAYVETLKRKANAFSGYVPLASRALSASAVAGTLSDAHRLDRTRYWRWGNGDEYRVKYSDNMWTVSSQSGTLLASLSSATAHIVRQDLNSLPVLRISPAVADETQRQFIILIMLYSETKRIERTH